MSKKLPTRRTVCKTLGVVVSLFTLRPGPAFPEVVGQVPASLKANPRLDSWIRLEPGGGVTVFTGKAELGQGILTALAQIAAEEFDVRVESIRMISADTSRGPDEQYTYGSQSIEQSGAALRAAAAKARSLLLIAAAKRFGTEPGKLKAGDGIISAPDGRSASYWDIASGEEGILNRDVTAVTTPKDPSSYKIVGKSVPRFDLPPKLTGQASYLQDLRLPGMVFGRVVRPPSYGAKLVSVDVDSIRSMPGVIAIVRDGNFLGVVAGREEQAIAVRQKLGEISKWVDDGDPLPDMTNLRDALPRWKGEDSAVATSGQSEAIPAAVRRLEAT